MITFLRIIFVRRVSNARSTALFAAFRYVLSLSPSSSYAYGFLWSATYACEWVYLIFFVVQVFILRLAVFSPLTLLRRVYVQHSLVPPPKKSLLVVGFIIISSYFIFLRLLFILVLLRFGLKKKERRKKRWNILFFFFLRNISSVCIWRLSAFFFGGLRQKSNIQQFVLFSYFVLLFFPLLHVYVYLDTSRTEAP